MRADCCATVWSWSSACDERVAHRRRSAGVTETQTSGRFGRLRWLVGAIDWASVDNAGMATGMEADVRPGEGAAAVLTENAGTGE